MGATRTQEYEEIEEMLFCLSPSIWDGLTVINCAFSQADSQNILDVENSPGVVSAQS